MWNLETGQRQRTLWASPIALFSQKEVSDMSVAPDLITRIMFCYIYIIHILHYIILYYITLCYVILYSIILHHIVLYYVTLYIILYYITLYIILYYIIYYTVLYYNIIISDYVPSVAGIPSLCKGHAY